MKPVYSSPGDQFIAEQEAAGDVWFAAHRAEWDAMAKEAFPPGWRPDRKGATQERMTFLNQQAALRAGFPSFPEWCRRNGHPIPEPTQESAA